MLIIRQGIHLYLKLVMHSKVQLDMLEHLSGSRVAPFFFSDVLPVFLNILLIKFVLVAESNYSPGLYGEKYVNPGRHFAYLAINMRDSIINHKLAQNAQKWESFCCIILTYGMKLWLRMFLLRVPRYSSVARSRLAVTEARDSLFPFKFFGLHKNALLTCP